MITYPISRNLCKKSSCNVVGSTIFHLSEAATGSVLLEKAFLEILQNSQESTCDKVSFLIKLQVEVTASDLSCVFSWRFLVYIISTEKMRWKKWNTLMEFKYLLFCSNIDLFDVKNFKRNLTDGNLIRKCVWREFDVAIFMVRGILLGKSFWTVNTWQAPVRKWLKGSTLNSAHTFLRGCYTKRCLCFS